MLLPLHSSPPSYCPSGAAEEAGVQGHELPAAGGGQVVVPAELPAPVEQGAGGHAGELGCLV